MRGNTERAEGVAAGLVVAAGCWALMTIVLAHGAFGAWLFGTPNNPGGSAVGDRTVALGGSDAGPVGALVVEGGAITVSPASQPVPESSSLEATVDVGAPRGGLAVPGAPPSPMGAAVELDAASDAVVLKVAPVAVPKAPAPSVGSTVWIQLVGMASASARLCAATGPAVAASTSAPFVNLASGRLASSSRGDWDVLAVPPSGN